MESTNSGHFLLLLTEVGPYAGVKVATVAPGSPSLGLPRIQAAFLQFDANTLSLRAVLDGTALTTLRTPAISIAAANPPLLASPNHTGAPRMAQALKASQKDGIDGTASLSFRTRRVRNGGMSWEDQFITSTVDNRC